MALTFHFPGQCQRKPKPGEEVKFAQVRNDLMIRVWGEDLASSACYCFDFVNREHQYILTPNDVKIYTAATAFSQASQFCPSRSRWKGRRRRHCTPTQPGMIQTGRHMSFLKAPFSVLHSRTTRILFSTYRCDTLLVRLALVSVM